MSMSALGHKRTFAVQKGMSALPPKADIAAHKPMSALCQKQTLPERKKNLQSPRRNEPAGF